jgi:ABC-2 type transport system ATP-binding protein
MEDTGIVLAGLSKSYGRIRAVRSLDLTIARGETVAILGPNGAGKSTTIDMMLGLTRPDAGTVTLFGLTPAEAAAAGLISGMLQTGSVPDYLSVRELITMVASLYPRPLAVDEVLRHTGAAEFAGRPTGKLSGGQAQRVRSAVALVANPDLLLLDEPTAALDVEGRREFWASIRGVAAGGATVVFATHYLAEADAFADRIVLMARGRVVADGPATQIKAMVGGRTIRATLPGVTLAELTALPGVLAADRHGDAVVLTCGAAEATLLGLLTRYPQVRDIEVHGAGLEEAFLELTSDDGEDGDDAGAKPGELTRTVTR